MSRRSATRADVSSSSRAAPQEMEEWDLAAAYEAMARAHATAGETDEARRYVELGGAALPRIEDEDDRAQLEGDFATISI